MKNVCVILGGGGHAGVLIDCLNLNISRSVKLFGILDQNPNLWGHEFLGIPVLGSDDMLIQLIEKGVNCFIVGLGGSGDTRPRQRLFELGLSFQLSPLTVIHPKSIVSQWANIGPGSQILPGSIINARAEIGRNVIINSGAIVEHDCNISDHVHIATGARLAGSVRVGKGAHVGAGAIIRQCINIGTGAVIGAGAVVVKDVPDHIVVVGVPAKPLKKMT
ncbi:MAG: acetyltransferase [Candidatus Aminicenantes bacterium]|nr:acetyltransferase [Candidatus Aminicenantes bacterium]